MDRLPFTLYDVLACVVSGLVVLIAGDAAFGTARLLQPELSVASNIAVIIGAYILGHVVAHLSGFFCEQLFVRGCLGAPEEVLLRERRLGVRAVLFPGYSDPLSARVRADVLAKGKAAGLTPRGSDLFSYCLPRVRKEATVAGKLETFLNLYGFCRNTSFALLCAGILFLVFAWRSPWQLPGGATAEVQWGIAGIVVSIILFYRYLKFFRLYTVEVYRAYAELDL